MLSLCTPSAGAIERLFGLTWTASSSRWVRDLLVAMQPGNLLFAAIGVLLGTLVGILPGISPSLTVALLLPVTFKLDPTGSLIMFAGIYFGGMYGSSTSAILLNTPGEAASIATAIEGHAMARAGRGGPALAHAAIGSPSPEHWRRSDWRHSRR